MLESPLSAAAAEAPAPAATGCDFHSPTTCYQLQVFARTIAWCASLAPQSSREAAASSCVCICWKGSGNLDFSFPQQAFWRAGHYLMDMCCLMLSKATDDGSTSRTNANVVLARPRNTTPRAPGDRTFFGVVQVPHGIMST